MANVTKPIALDESLNTTENTPRNIADVLASGLSSIANNVKPDGGDISIDVPGMSANNVDDGFSELKQSIVNKAYCIVTINPSTSSGLSDFPYQATFQLSQQTWYKISPNGSTTQITNFADEVNYIFTMTHKAYGESNNGVITICEPYFNWAYSGYDSIITKFNGRLNPDYWKIIATITGNVKVIFTIDYK